MAQVDILDSWEPLVSPRVRRAPGELVRQQVRETLRDFLKTTRAWQNVPAAQNIVALQPKYTLVTPFSDAEVIEVEWLQVSNPAGSGGSPSTPKTVDWLDENVPSWRVAAGDDFTYFAAEDPTSITFSSIPQTSVTGALSYRLSLQPIQTAVVIDDSVLKNYGMEVAYGALARLFSMAEAAWYNEKSAAAEGAKYHREKHRVAIRVRQQFGRVEQHMQAKYKFAGV